MANAKKASITGVKTEAQKAKALTAAKGPKLGSARSNQSAKYEETAKSSPAIAKLANKARAANAATESKASKLVAKPDVIKEVKGTTDGRYIAVKAGGDNVLTYPVTTTGKELAKLAAVGASFKALQNWLKTHKPEAKLATGLDSRSAPQSAMAAAESRKSGKGSASTATGTGGAAGVKTKAVSPSKGDFSYSVGKANDTRPDTWTRYMVTLIQKHTDTVSAKAAHAKSGKYAGKKLDFTWSKTKGFIK